MAVTSAICCGAIVIVVVTTIFGINSVDRIKWKAIDV